MDQMLNDVKKFYNQSDYKNTTPHETEKLSLANIDPGIESECQSP